MAATTEAILAEVAAAIEHLGKTSIVALAGVPGTGKSHMAMMAARHFAGHPLLVETIQFHQGYGYEEFVEGLRPTPVGGFEISEGVLMRWNDRATADKQNRYVLVIEELTRANLSAVLGELLSLIEYRGRSITLPISKRPLVIAENLRFVATYNPHDRNAIDVDDALLRRLAIIECGPSSAQLREMLGSTLGNTTEGQATIEKLAKLFDEIEAITGDRFPSVMPFGHGIFSTVRNEDDLKRIWRQRLRHFIARPNQPRHELADEISSRYPWK